MCKKSLLMMLLLALLVPWAAKAQTTVTIGEGTATCNTNPIGTYYNYSIAEQLYTAEEIGTAGTISSISFYYMGIAAKDLPITVYMKHVDEVDLASGGITLADADEVFSGTLPVTTTAGWVTINLATPFAYDGSSNLLIGFIKDYLYYFSGQSWQGTATTATMARYTQSDSAGPYTTSTVPSSAQANRPNIQIVITPSSGPTCTKPGTLDVTDITGYTATCTWENTGAASYTFEWKKATDSDYTVVAGLTTTTYPLSGLEPYTAYSVRVKAVCGTDLESGYKTASFTTLDVCPEGMVCIGEGEATNTALPLNNFYKHSFTQQIYTGEEIGTEGAILSIEFYKNNTLECVRNIDIYMVNTEKRSFDSVSDWIAVTAANLVFSGEVTFENNGWTNIELDNPFIIIGGSNVALVVNDKTGSYKSSTTFFAYESEAQSLYAYRDGSDTYDPEALPSGTIGTMKNRVRFAIGEPPACPKPTGLAVNYEGGTSATFTWTENGTATSWDLYYSTDPDFTSYTQKQVDGTPTYELTGLELATTYYVRVNAFCDAPSDYSNTVSFTTDFCMPEDKCELTFVLTDSYGDGWNGNAIQVVDVETERVLGQFTNTSEAGAGEAQTYTLALCEGREIEFVWVKGSYPGEASWIVMDINGEEITSGTGTTSMNTGDVLATYTMSCVITDCKRPTHLAATEIGNHSAVLSWTENGEATEWVVEITDVVGGQNTEWNAGTNPYTLVGLDPETEYSVRVRPICSDFDDKWSNPITFTTEVACPVPTNLEANNVTALSALISWNGFGESYDLRYMPVAGATPIGGGEEKTFTGNLNMQLMANPDARPNVNTRANGLRDGWYNYDNGEFATSIGTGSSTDVYWGIMLPAGMTSETTLTKVALYETSSNNAGETITLYVYAGGTDAPGTLLYTEEFEPEAADAFHEITLATPVDVDPLQNLWIVLMQNGNYPAAGCVNTGDANGRWISLDGEAWNDVADYGLEYTWMIRAYLEGEAVLPWIDVTGIDANEYEMTELDPETTYVVQVRANCGDDGSGEWTNSLEFTTGSLCDVPYDLTASDITFTSVTLDWVNALESFNLRYRPVVHGEVLAEQNFDENSMGNWTTIDADEDGYDWVLGSECGGVYLVAGSSIAGRNGSADLAVSGSYSNVSGVGALTPDNYLVSPQITLGGTISFWACAQDASYAAEHFGVAVSTTVNDTAAAFTTIWETTMTAKGTGAKMNPGTTRSGNRAQGTWYQFTVDLSAYVGQTGYVAIRHFDCTDWFMLDVDDIVIEGYVETPEWVVINGTENPVVLTDLTYDTEYEWQVQGINAGCEGGTTEWSETATFFFPMPTQTIALTAGVNWVSFYVETTMSNLRAALVEALPGTAISIKSRNKTTTYNPNNGRWTGQLNALDLSQMYLINVTDDCEISLKGNVIDPSEHPATIINGINWIAFPLSVNMTPTNAFAGFAINGDVIKSRTQTSTYTRGRWMGQVNLLEPGNGYIYNSSSSNSRTLVFPTPAK